MCVCAVQAERPITSVGWVRFMTDPSDFQIYFKDSLEDIVTDYTAESPYECGALRCIHCSSAVHVKRI